MQVAAPAWSIAAVAEGAGCLGSRVHDHCSAAAAVQGTALHRAEQRETRRRLHMSVGGVRAVLGRKKGRGGGGLHSSSDALGLWLWRGRTATAGCAAC